MDGQFSRFLLKGLVKVEDVWLMAVSIENGLDFLYVISKSASVNTKTPSNSHFDFLILILFASATFQTKQKCTSTTLSYTRLSTSRTLELRMSSLCFFLFFFLKERVFLHVC